MSDDITPPPAEEPIDPQEQPAEDAAAPDDPEIAALIGEAMVALRDQGDVDGALALLEDAAQRAPGDMMVHFCGLHVDISNCCLFQPSWERR